MHANELVVCLAFTTVEYLGLNLTRGVPFLQIFILSIQPLHISPSLSKTFKEKVNFCNSILVYCLQRYGT